MHSLQKFLVKETNTRYYIDSTGVTEFDGLGLTNKYEYLIDTNKVGLTVKSFEKDTLFETWIFQYERQMIN